MLKSITIPYPVSRVQANYPFKVIGLFIIVVIGAFVRDYNAYLHPVMACEDGGMMFAYYTNHPALSEIMRFYNGYISVLPNAIGYLSALVRPTFAPYVLAWYALLITSLAHTLFYLRRFQFIVADDRKRLWICLFLACVPLGYALLNSNTTYSLWNLLWILLLLVCAPVGSSRLGQVLQFGFMTLAIWSHPLSLLVLPICVYNLFARRDLSNRMMNVGVILVAVAYQFFGVEPHPSQISYLVRGAFYSLLYVLDQVAVESLSGYQLRIRLFQAHYSWLLHIVGIAILCGVGLLWFRLRRSLTQQAHLQILALFYVILGATALSAIGRLMTATSHMTPWNNRYFYVQQFLFLLMIAILLATLAEQVTLRTSQQIGIVLLLVGYLVVQNLHNRPNFRTPLGEGIRTALFLQQIEEGQKNLAPGATREFKLERPCFNIEVQSTG